MPSFKLPTDCHSSYDALIQLSLAPNGRMQMFELAEAVHLSRSGPTRLVDRMECQGLLERHRGDHDPRQVFACITGPGLERLAETTPTHLAGVRRRFSNGFLRPKWNSWRSYGTNCWRARLKVNEESGRQIRRYRQALKRESLGDLVERTGKRISPISPWAERKPSDPRHYDAWPRPVRSLSKGSGANLLPRRLPRGSSR